MKNYFNYSMPSRTELRERYYLPYRFSDELCNEVIYCFTHPHCKYSQFFTKHHTKYDAHDMLRTPYLMMRYYLDYPQRFGHSAENITDHIVVAMWRRFVTLHKLRGNWKYSYKRAPMKLIELLNKRVMETLIKDINTYNIQYEDRGYSTNKINMNSKWYLPPLIEGTKEFEDLCLLD